MTHHYVLGVDPGSSGAVALLHSTGRSIGVLDVPTVLANKSSKRRMLDAYGFAKMVRALTAPAGSPLIAVIENVNAMPQQGVASVFSFGKSFGIAIGVLAALEISIEFITPQQWKKHYRIGKDKEQARELAIRLFPTVELGLHKHHNRAEALLIAKYYQEKVLGFPIRLHQ